MAEKKPSIKILIETTDTPCGKKTVGMLEDKTNSLDEELQKDLMQAAFELKEILDAEAEKIDLRVTGERADG